MDSSYITFIVSVVVVASVAFAYTWFQNRAFDRRWGKRPPAE